MRKYFLILLLLISGSGFSQAPNIIYGKDVIIQTRDTSSAELTIKNSTRNVLGYFKNIGGGKGQYVIIPQTDITGLPDSLLARYTKAQADARFKSISYVPAWLEITDKPANFSTTHALSNDIQDSLLNKVSRDGSYANPSWITSLDYSKLTGTVPTWNQNTTGNAATVTNGVYTTGSYANPSWITELAWSKVSGAPAFITGINSSMVTTALGYTPENLANKGIANGYADLDATGKIPASRIDFGQTGQTFVVASQAAMLAVSGANVGALAVRTDENKNYRLIAQPASTLANWQVLLSPDAPVQSVNGFTGNVNLLTTHISEGSNYWWTAARSRAAQSLTTSGSSGAATYDNTTGVLNIPTYSLAGLGGQPALSGTGFVKISGTTITYDNSTYLTSYTETDPTIYAWAKATTKPSYSWGEITGTVPTWNQNTTGTAGSLSAVLSKTLGGAGDVTGILKANGTGTVSAAVAGDITTLISGTYLPLSGGTLTGSLSGTNFAIGARSTSNAFQFPDWRIYNTAGGNLAFNDFTADRVTLSSSTLSLGVALSGTSLSMSGNIEGASAYFSNTNASATAQTILSINEKRSDNPSSGNGVQMDFGLANSGNPPNTRGRISLTNTFFKSNSDMVFYNAVSDALQESLRLRGSDNTVIAASKLLVNTATNNGTDALQVAGSGLFTANSGSSDVLKFRSASSASGNGVLFSYSDGTGVSNGIGSNFSLNGGGGFVRPNTSLSAWTISMDNRTTPVFSVNYVNTSNEYSTHLTIASTGAATFSSSVTATKSQWTGAGEVFYTNNAGTSSIFGRFVNSGGDFYIGRDNSAGTQFPSSEAYASIFYSEGARPMIFWTNGTKALTIASNQSATFSSSVTASSLIKSGSSDSYFLLGGGGHVATSTYATTASLSSYVNTTGNQYEIGGNKSFLGAVEVVSLKTTGGPGTPGVLKFGGKTNDTVFTGGSQYVLPVNIDGTTYYIRLWAGIN